MTANQIRYSAGYKYQLREDAALPVALRPSKLAKIEMASLDVDRVLRVKSGYAWNGATGIYDRRTVIMASLIHDVLVQMVRLGVLDDSYRPQIDKEFTRQIVSAGGWRFLARLDLVGLRWFSEGAYRPSSEPVVLSAP